MKNWLMVTVAGLVCGVAAAAETVPVVLPDADDAQRAGQTTRAALDKADATVRDSLDRAGEAVRDSMDKADDKAREWRRDWRDRDSRDSDRYGESRDRRDVRDMRDRYRDDRFDADSRMGPEDRRYWNYRKFRDDRQYRDGWRGRLNRSYRNGDPAGRREFDAETRQYFARFEQKGSLASGLLGQDDLAVVTEAMERAGEVMDARRNLAETYREKRRFDRGRKMREDGYEQLKRDVERLRRMNDADRTAAQREIDGLKSQIDARKDQIGREENDARRETLERANEDAQKRLDAKEEAMDAWKEGQNNREDGWQKWTAEVDSRKQALNERRDALAAELNMAEDDYRESLENADRYFSRPEVREALAKFDRNLRNLGFLQNQAGMTGSVTPDRATTSSATAATAGTEGYRQGDYGVRYDVGTPVRFAPAAATPSTDYGCNTVQSRPVVYGCR